MYIIVDVKPSQRVEAIEEIDKRHFLVYVKEPAKKGKANKAVIKILKHYFNKEVQLISGHTSSRKILEVEE